MKKASLYFCKNCGKLFTPQVSIVKNKVKHNKDFCTMECADDFFSIRRITDYHQLFYRTYGITSDTRDRFRRALNINKLNIFDSDQKNINIVQSNTLSNKNFSNHTENGAITGHIIISKSVISDPHIKIHNFNTHKG